MKRILCIAGASCLLPMLGCGTGVQQALLLAAESGGRTLLDVWISDLYTNLPDLFSLPPGPGEPVGDGSTGGGDTGGTNGGGTNDGGTGDGGTSGGGTSGGDLTGDAGLGQMLFSANSCKLCHCDDASGGCLSGAPNIQGKDFATIKERLQGETPHPGGKFPEFTDQDIADIQAFLAQQAGS